MATDRELVDGLGGPTAVARLCGVTPPAVTNWLKRGQIPAEHHVALWAAAQETGLDWAPPGGAGFRLVPREAA